MKRHLNTDFRRFILERIKGNANKDSKLNEVEPDDLVIDSEEEPSENNTYSDFEKIIGDKDEQLEQHQVDVSMCRWCKNPNGSNSVLLDAGDYYLITDLQFRNFKLHAHVNNDSAT
jgi:hypothetical protein